MDLILHLPLNAWQMSIILLVCLYIIWSGHPEWAVAIYLAAGLWARIMMFGPISQIWIFMATMALSSVSYMIRKRSFKLLPTRGRWIVVWMGCWWLWMAILLEALDQQQFRLDLYRNLLLYIIAPLPIILVFASELRRVGGFALAFILTTICGGMVSVVLYGISFGSILSGQMIETGSQSYLGMLNYHYFGFATGISLIMALALYLNSRSRLTGLIFLLGGFVCLVLLLLSGSRQSLASGVLVASIFCYWGLRKGRKTWAPITFLSGIIGITIVLVFVTLPGIIEKGTSRTISGAFESSISTRYNLWSKGWRLFVDSPLYGTGFQFESISHNIFISLLAEQGLVGVIFLIGFLVFLMKQFGGIWSGEGENRIALWRMAFACIVLFALIHGQFSGNILSTYELYWSGAFLWVLNQSTGEGALAS
jgi:O-antigen ligase